VKETCYGATEAYHEKEDCHPGVVDASFLVIKLILESSEAHPGGMEPPWSHERQSLKWQRPIHESEMLNWSGRRLQLES
jgi:hypothetical protein